MRKRCTSEEVVWNFEHIPETIVRTRDLLCIIAG
jgi:hypothetical protein